LTGMDVSSIDRFVTGSKFRKLRRDAGYSQSQLSRELDITIRSLTRWERGETPVPKIAELALKYVIEKRRGKGRS